MEPVIDTNQDPLIVALPPATDYITYLTLLEYQLKPDNLSTLNRLLSEDDGTLAAEIGWDLLKLVLPMLQIVPDDANECLSIIARRGNPREVVVRVAEELETLGQDEEEDDNEDGLLDQDGLPTFPGEAPRIHLGEMKLDGMPPEEKKPTYLEPEVAQSDRKASIAVSGSDNILIFQALISMLAILHPRIKTQYPSRFLATSLPAALGAYRRMAITSDTTTAFINFLSKLSGKQRPNLPPRISTAQNIPTTKTTRMSADKVDAPPLPDPEAKTDASSKNTTSIASEQAITQRLLQAVMLEVLDEYTSSFQSTTQPSMSWTTRLREKHEPKRVLPNRPTEIQRWTQSPELSTRDGTIASFLRLSKNVNLDLTKEVDKLTDPAAAAEAEPIEQPETDYPTSPSHIPLSTSGLFLLFAAQNFAQDTTGLTGPSPLSVDAIRHVYRATFAPPQDLPHPPSLSQTDALLSLLYTTLQSPLSQTQPSSTDEKSTIDLPFLTNLTNLFTTSPDPSIRDSTHHLTTLLLHNFTNSETKLLYIKSLLSTHTPSSPIQEIQQGNLRAIAINWLKDEFLAHDTTTDTLANDPTQLPQSTTPTNPGLAPSITYTDPDLLALIFPVLPTPPSPFISSQPTPALSDETDLESLLLNLPAWTASLNLLSILANLSDDETTVLENAEVLQSATQFLASVTAWKDLLLGFVGGIKQSEDGGPVDVADVYALEDAVGRVKGVVEGLL